MKTALITGVAGGMGFAAAKRLIREGWRVAGLDVREPEDREGILFFRTDLTDPRSVEASLQGVKEAGLTFDAILHMAGLYDLNSLLEMPEEDFLRIWNVNLFGVYRVNKAFFPLLRKNARILITASELAPLHPLPFTGIYGITKTALDRYAESLRMELQLVGHPVIVLRPGAVDTGLLRVSTDKLDRFVKETKLYPLHAERFRRIVDRVETRRVQPERIAALAMKALRAEKPRFTYAINRNPGLLLLNALPVRWQCGIIRRILTL